MIQVSAAMTISSRNRMVYADGNVTLRSSGAPAGAVPSGGTPSLGAITGVPGVEETSVTLAPEGCSFVVHMQSVRSQVRAHYEHHYASGGAAAVFASSSASRLIRS